MKRPASLALRFPALWITILASGTWAQNPPACPGVPSSTSSILEIGVQNGSGGWIWTCDNNYLSSSTSPHFAGKLRLHAVKGTWMTVALRSWVDDITNPGSQAAQDFWNGTGAFSGFPHPWLIPPNWNSLHDPGPYWQGQPGPIVSGLIFDLLVHLGLMNFGTGQWSEDAVRGTYQPAVEDDSSNASLGFRVWNGIPPVWCGDYSGTGFGPAVMKPLWSNYCLNPTATPADEFPFQGLAQLAMYLQAGDPAMVDSFLNSDQLVTAYQNNLGLYVGIQGICFISGSPSFTPSSNETQTPGLTGFTTPSGGLYYPPAPSLTNRVVAFVPWGAPVTCNCGGIPGSTGPHQVEPGQRIDLSILRGWPPLTVRFIGQSSQGGTGVIAPTITHYSYWRPFWVEVRTPPLPVGTSWTIQATNGLNLSYVVGAVQIEPPGP